MAGFLQRHKITLASIVLLTIGAMALVVFALSSDGYPVRHVNLNDGGIWVTSNADHLFGRLNKPAGSIDAAINRVSDEASAQPSLDVSQSGAAVVAWDKGAGKLYPVDVVKASLAKDHAASVTSDEDVRLAGGTLAVLDHSTGKVWAQRVDPALGISAVAGIDSGAKPLARVDVATSKAQPALTVAQDGTVYAVSSAGQTVSLSPTSTGFSPPRISKLSARMESAQATTVGTDLVVLDSSTGTLVLPGDHSVHVEVGKDAVLQASSDPSSSVVVATTKSLLSIDLGSGHVTVLYDKADGAPAQPTWLGGCVYGAWAGTPGTNPGTYVHSCAGEPAVPGNVKNDEALKNPVFRVNRDSIVLNDLSTGLVIDLTNGRKVDNWKAVNPPPVQAQQSDNQNQTPDPNQQDQPPKPADDTLGARPGRTTVLHVLDNDSDPQGYILAIIGVTAADDPTAKISIAPDRQTVEITLPSNSAGAHFRYTVDDGKGQSQSANVEVQARGTTDNMPPNLRFGFKKQTWNVAAGGTLSLPVIGDWRDPDGDPPVLTDASAASGSVTTTSDGRVTFTAGLEPGPVTLTYHVSDGFPGSAPTSESIDVNVLNADSTTNTAPVAEPDIARGVVGQPITIRPLDNDLPGADPTNPGAVLAIAGQVVSPAGAIVTTDVKTGIVTLTADRAGSFPLSYSAAFGNAPFSLAQSIRVDVDPPPSSDLSPVAVPDNSAPRSQPRCRLHTTREFYTVTLRGRADR